MRYYKTILLLILSAYILGCAESVEIEKLEFYDPEFTLDSTTQLRTDGYYQIQEVFKTFLPSNDSIVKPFKSDTSYGFIQFFVDGFCRVGNWNGLYKDSLAVRRQIISNGSRWRWGLFKIETDTVRIEYTRKWEESLFKTIYYRQEVIGIFRQEKLLIIKDPPVRYNYPPNPNHSAQSCIGEFIKIKFDYGELNNFIKKEPEKYLKLE